MSETRNWSELCPDLLEIISRKINRVDDLIRFGSVCCLWRSVIVDNKHSYRLFTNPSPWLMLSESKNNHTRRSFFSISENTIHKVDLPEAVGRHCWGSPFGWLITFGLDRQLQLLNPLSGTTLSLPPVETLEDSHYEDQPESIRATYIKKAVIVPLTPDSTVENFMVFLTYSVWHLACARPGDKSWTCVSKNKREEYWDVLYLKGQFYSIDGYGTVRIHDFTNSDTSSITLFAEPPPDLDTPLPFYLLELDGQLHMALRLIDTDKAPKPLELFHTTITSAVAIFKWDSLTSTWELLDTLGDYSIFVGSNTSFALLASQHPNCKPDCIYFTDDYPMYEQSLCGKDSGIYNYETDEIEVFYGEDDDNMFSRFSPPVWFTPKFL